jgi:hypothetical protein
MIFDREVKNFIIKLRQNYPKKDIAISIAHIKEYLLKRNSYQTQNRAPSNLPSSKKIQFTEKEKQIITQVDENALHEAILLFELIGRCQVLRPNTYREAALEVLRMAEGLAFVPEKYRSNDVFDEFDASSVKNASTNLSEAWLNQLLQIHSISADRAIAITTEYPTMASLYETYCSDAITLQQKEELLSNLQYGPKNRRIGVEISRRIYRFFTSTDPREMIFETNLQFERTNPEIDVRGTLNETPQNVTKNHENCRLDDIRESMKGGITSMREPRLSVSQNKKRHDDHIRKDLSNEFPTQKKRKKEQRNISNAVVNPFNPIQGMNSTSKSSNLENCSNQSPIFDLRSLEENCSMKTQQTVKKTSNMISQSRKVMRGNAHWGERICNEGTGFDEEPTIIVD